jgi:GNAT superfamily N-acetyltransferase
VEEPHPLRTILESAARGRFPEADGSVRVFPSPPGKSQAVCGFTAHHVISANVSHEEVLERIDPSDLGAALNPRFVTWLGRRLEAAPGSLDVVLAAPGLADPHDGLLRESPPVEHARVSRAERYREQVAVYTAVNGEAVVVLGRGLAGRREVSLEIDEAARGRGLGRRLLLGARSLIPEGDVVFAQVAPGNAASLRAFLAAGFSPIGSEVLFLTS